MRGDDARGRDTHNSRGDVMEVAQPAAFHFPRDDPRMTEARRPEGESNRPVPNHLLESKVYTKLGKNGSVHSEPPVLHFGGYEVGTCHHQVLKLINISPDVTTIHIIPPQSKHFTISYKKANRLVPGLAFAVHVQFIPDEWRYYYDCVRIHCKGDETLLVPLHAYPTADLQDVVAHVGLRVACLGHSARHVLPLRCHYPVDFEFRIICREPHKDFHVTPTSGIIPGNGAVDVVVTFTPSSYGTARIVLELMTSEFNDKPRSCVITGACSPNLCAVKEESERVSSKVSPKSPEKVPFRISRKKKHLQSLQQNASQVIEFQNLRFPLNLSNPHAVASVLNQHAGKLRLKDMREGLVRPAKRTRQEKETLFLQVVQQNVAEEEANQLRWQIHRGSDPVTPKLRQRITEERQSAEDQYQVMIGRPDLHIEYNRQSVVTSSPRVLRRAGHHLTVQPQFDLYLNELWANRNRALRRFQQAARKVLIGCRVNHRLGHLRNLLQRLRAERGGGGAFESTDDETICILPTNHIVVQDFPPYPADPEGATPDLCLVTPKPAAVQMRVKLPFHDLKVPQHYKVMGYQAVGTHSGSLTYHSPQLARPLRSGAEDELVPIGISRPDVLSLRTESSTITHLTLSPPKQLLHPPDFHPMHVFNPAPGLVAFKRPLPYCDTGLQYHLCPSLRDTNRKFLSREEVIRGVMTWKKFPSVVLSVTLPNADNGRPRWCDPFSADLLPPEAPPTLSRLPPEDADNIVPREAGEAPCGGSLTPEMLRAEFTLIQDGGQSDAGPSEPQTGGQNLEAEASLADKIRRHLRLVKLLALNKKLILE